MTEETLEPVETETDPEERIRELTAENRRLRKRIKQMREAAATSKKVEFSKIIFCGVSIVTILITVFSCWIIYSTMDASALAYLIPPCSLKWRARPVFTTRSPSLKTKSN